MSQKNSQGFIETADWLEVVLCAWENGPLGPWEAKDGWVAVTGMSLKHVGDWTWKSGGRTKMVKFV